MFIPPLTSSSQADQTSMVARDVSIKLVAEIQLVTVSKLMADFACSCMSFGVGHEGVDLAVLVNRPLVNFTVILLPRQPLHVMQGHQELAH